TLWTYCFLLSLGCLASFRGCERGSALVYQCHSSPEYESHRSMADPQIQKPTSERRRCLLDRDPRVQRCSSALRPCMWDRASHFGTHSVGKHVLSMPRIPQDPIRSRRWARRGILRMSAQSENPHQRPACASLSPCARVPQQQRGDLLRGS